MNKRGAYFFVIDALIAATIIFMSLIVIFSSRSAVPESNPTLRLVNDYTSYLSNTHVREMTGNFTSELLINKTISDPDNTVIEQMVEFYYYGNMTYLSRFIDEASKGNIPEQRNIEIFINDTSVYNRIYSPQAKSDLVLNIKKFGFIRVNKTYIYGPVTVEVRIWV